MVYPGFGVIAWDGHADFATVALPPLASEPPQEAALASDRLLSAWEIYQLLLAGPESAVVAATPVVKLAPQAMVDAVREVTDVWPLSCTYRTCFYDDDDGRRLEQYFGPILIAADRKEEARPDEHRHNYLAFLPERPLIELFPLAALCAACTLGNPELFDRALALGADLARPLMEGRGGKYITYPRHPLVMAIEAGQLWTVERLLAAGADPAILDYADYRVQERLRLQPVIARAIMATGYPATRNEDGRSGSREWAHRQSLTEEEFIAATISAGAFAPGDCPAAALPAGETCEVIVDIWVAGTRPSGCRVVESSGSAMLDERICEIILDRFWFDAPSGRHLPRPVTMRHNVIWPPGAPEK